jgi:hypothetical protein
LTTAIPKIELIHWKGNYVVALGQADDLHGHMFAFVGDHVDNQLPSIFLEPTQGGALATFSTVRVDVQAVITAHYAQADPPIFLPSTTAGVATDGYDGGMHDPIDVGTILYHRWHFQGHSGQDRVVGCIRSPGR